MTTSYKSIRSEKFKFSQFFWTLEFDDLQVTKINKNSRNRKLIWAGHAQTFLSMLRSTSCPLSFGFF